MSAFDLTEKEILLRSLGQFQKICDDQQKQIATLVEMTRGKHPDMSRIEQLEAEVEMLRQENGSLKMRLEDREL